MKLRIGNVCAALSAVCVMVWFPCSGLAATWYVEAGSSGNGTQQDPFGTIQEGVDAAQPGDEVVVSAGTYNESVQTMRGGTAGSPIVLRAADGAARQVLVTASGRVLRVDHPYITVEGLVMDAQYGDREVVDLNDEADHFVLRNCEARRTSRNCVNMSAPSNVLFEDCLIHHCLDATGGRADAHGITGGAVHDLVIRRTEIHTFSGDGVQFDPGREQPGWDRITIEGCRIWLEPLPQPENGFAAGVVPGENAVDTKTWNDAPRATLLIRDSVFYGFRDGLIGNMAALNLKENIDVTVNRVTVYDSEIAFRLRGPTSTRPAGSWVRVQNAVVYDVDTAVRYEDDIENLRVWNVTMGGQVGQAFVEASSDQSVLDVRNFLILAGSLPAEAQGIASNLAVDAASFEDAAGHDYHLAAGSPAIEAGETIAEVATDRDSVLRPQDVSYEVGAYEYCPNGCQPTYQDGGIPASDSGIPHVDSGVPSADSGNVGGGTSRSGCGCRAGRGAPAAPWVAIFLLVLGLLARHRSVLRKVRFVTILDPK